MKKFCIAIAIVLCSISLISCSSEKVTASKEINDTSVAEEVKITPEPPKQEVKIETEKPKETKKAEEIKSPIEIDYKKVKPYEVGQIMVIMYHGIVTGVAPSSYQRNVEDFKQDLQTMYDNGFRLIKMQDLIDNNIKVEAGYTPVVLTFDDGIDTSFSLVLKDGVLVPKENSAVDILNKFSDTHKGFGKAATFYINGSAEPFKGDGTLKERFNYLIENGYDIGNHTYNHKNLKELDALELQKEIAKVEKMIKDELPNYKVTSLSYPFGKRPKEELGSYALEGEFEGINYKYELAVREGQSGASASPNHVKFDTLNIPRVRGSNDENTDLGWHFEEYKKSPELRYISDGNPNTISVMKEYEGNVNKESLGEKILNIYSLE